MPLLPREGVSYWVEMNGMHSGEFYPAATLHTAEKLAEAFATDSEAPVKIYEVTTRVKAHSSFPPAPAKGEPHDCTNCGVGNDDCNDRVRRLGTPCCGRCHITDTHGALQGGG